MSEKEKGELRRRVYQYALRTIELLDSLPGDSVSRTIAHQLLRAATSVGANVEEAQAGCSRRDFTNFYHHSFKSAVESRYWLGLLRDSRRATGVVVERLSNEAEELSNMLGASLLTLKGKR